MGFHKRWITEDILMGHYGAYGAQGIADLWKADAIITNGDLACYVSDILCSEYLTNEESLEIATFMVHIAALEKIEYEKKKKTITTS